MIPEVSTKVRKLTPAEVNDLHQELDDNSGLWMQHPMNKTVLAEGETIIINWVTKINSYYQLQWTFRKKFPSTWKLIESMANGDEIGKVYWVCVPPGVDVSPHVDSNNPYIRDGNACNRYQIYLDIPKEVDLVFDGLKTPIDDTSLMENALYDFAANKVHAVYNKSDRPFYALVFDVLNPGVVIYNDLYCINETNNSGINRLTHDTRIDS